jgi:hypothetical protein
VNLRTNKEHEFEKKVNEGIEYTKSMLVNSLGPYLAQNLSMKVNAKYTGNYTIYFDVNLDGKMIFFTRTLYVISPVVIDTVATDRNEGFDILDESSDVYKIYDFHQYRHMPFFRYRESNVEKLKILVINKSNITLTNMYLSFENVLPGLEIYPARMSIEKLKAYEGAVILLRLEGKATGDYGFFDESRSFVAYIEYEGLISWFGPCGLVVRKAESSHVSTPVIFVVPCLVIAIPITVRKAWKFVWRD